MEYRSRKRRQIADINVVPYIDGMLVLLIIFMITAPLLTEGVKIDLPEADANVIEPNPDAPEPMILSVDADGQLYIDDLAKSPQEVLVYATAYLRNNPYADFFVRGDANARYNDVLQAMVLLKESGVNTVSLITQPPERDSE